MTRDSYKRKTIEYNPAHDSHGYKNVRWVENVSHGLRLIGFADKIVTSIRHNGWYTDDDGDYDLYRGIVYQLPARAGKEQYVYGYADPNNDGCALLCFEAEETKEDAARAADRFAEIMAEHERDYRRAWDAGNEYRDLANEIKETRAQALALASEMRAARAVKVVAPMICATLRIKIMSLYKHIQKVRRERAELLENFGNCDGFTE